MEGVERRGFAARLPLAEGRGEGMKHETDKNEIQ
jgi:hypothetical protein